MGFMRREPPKRPSFTRSQYVPDKRQTADEAYAEYQHHLRTCKDCIEGGKWIKGFGMCEIGYNLREAWGRIPWKPEMKAA